MPPSQKLSILFFGKSNLFGLFSFRDNYEFMITGIIQNCDNTISIAFVIPQRPLVRGTPPNTPFERMEVFMEGLFFAIGFLLGGVVGVLIMCLLQINRIGRKEDSEE